VHWINVAQNTDQWRVLVDTVMKLGVLQKLENSRVAKHLFTSQEELCSKELVTKRPKDNHYLQCNRNHNKHRDLKFSRN
jgi:hypothetical protein